MSGGWAVLLAGGDHAEQGLCMKTTKPFMFVLMCLSWQSTTQTASRATSASVSGTPLKVAIVITEKFNFLDAVGPWEVFSHAIRFKDGQNREQGESLFERYFVSNTTEPVHTWDGAAVTPTYTFKSAPEPDIIVVGAQTGDPPELYVWLREQSSKGSTIMSVCVGAAKLAKAGLLDGKYATTHHEAFGIFEENYPKVHWVHDRRYVRASDTLFTGGGDGVSGIDLALHLIDLRFGRKVAQDDADYMEYHGEEWKQDDRVP